VDSHWALLEVLSGSNMRPMYAADVARYGVEGLRDEINKALEVLSQIVDRQHDKVTWNGLFCVLCFVFHCTVENLEKNLRPMRPMRPMRMWPGMVWKGYGMRLIKHLRSYLK
jgi:hypothetical protein